MLILCPLVLPVLPSPVGAPLWWPLTPEFLAIPASADPSPPRPPRLTLTPAPQGTTAGHSYFPPAVQSDLGDNTQRQSRPRGGSPCVPDRLAHSPGCPFPLSPSAVAGWGVSSSLGERTQSLRSCRSRPSSFPPLPPHRVRPGLQAASAAALTGCSRHGRGAAPGSRLQEPLAGDSRAAAQQFRVSGRRPRRPPRAWGRPPEARAPRRRGEQGRGRARSGRRAERKERPSSRAPWGLQEELLTQQCGQPVTLALSALQARAQVRGPGDFGRDFLLFCCCCLAF